MGKGVIKVIRKEYPFAQIPNYILEDTRISFRAKGLLCYLISKPNGWSVIIEDLYSKTVEGYTAIRSAIDELLLTGYMELRNDFDPKIGFFTGRYYLIREEPLFRKGYRQENNKNKNFRSEEILIENIETRKSLKIKYNNDNHI